MGLDVYLYKCADRAEAGRIEAEYEKRIEALWSEVGGFSNATEEQCEQVHAKDNAIADELGIVNYRHESRQAIQEHSVIDPDHYFKIGYLRSSYNASGINGVLRNAGVPDLNDIFGVNNNTPYEFVPDWAASLDRVNSAIEQFEASLKQPGGNVRVSKIMAIPIRQGDAPKDQADALRIYRAEAAKNQSTPFRAYGSGLGEFYLDGLKVRALIPGTIPGLFSRGEPEPAVYVIFDAATEDGKEDGYLTALKITREMIEYVIAQPDAKDYYFAWSA